MRAIVSVAFPAWPLPSSPGHRVAAELGQGGITAILPADDARGMQGTEGLCHRPTYDGACRLVGMGDSAQRDAIRRGRAGDRKEVSGEGEDCATTKGRSPCGRVVPWQTSENRGEVAIAILVFCVVWIAVGKPLKEGLALALEPRRLVR